jgi:rod shape-determining protein MreB
MWGKTPSHISIVRPLIEGVVSDFEVAEEMLAYFLKKAEAASKKFFRPRVLVGVPSGITNVETRAVYDAAINAGAREAYLVEEAMAAAIGARLPVMSSKASFIVDIGGGTTDIALIALGGIVRSLNLRVAGDHLNARIIDYLRDEFKLFVGEPTAEVAKITLASMQPEEYEKEYIELEVRGRDISSGLPKGMMVTDTDIREALSFPLSLILAGIREVLESAPPEMMSDILVDGITLTGGGALLRGLSTLLETELNLPVKISDDPLSAVARGTGIVLEQFDTYKSVLLSLDEYAQTY